MFQRAFKTSSFTMLSTATSCISWARRPSFTLTHRIARSPPVQVSRPILKVGSTMKIKNNWLHFVANLTRTAFFSCSLIQTPKMQTKRTSSLTNFTTVSVLTELKRTEPSTAKEVAEVKSLKFWFKIITHDANGLAWLPPRTPLGTKFLMFLTSIHTISIKNRIAISAKEIKTICAKFTETAEKEPRIICYQAQRKDRPQLFIDRGLFILPVKNGHYVLVKETNDCDGYIDIPPITSSPVEFRSSLTFPLRSSEVGDSEMQHVDKAYALRHYPRLLRRRTDVFDHTGTQVLSRIFILCRFTRLWWQKVSKQKLTQVMREKIRLSSLKQKTPK